jgi:hypothetical protein
VDPRMTQWAADRDLDVELPAAGSGDEFGFDPLLRDLARHTDRATAVGTAEYAEYPAAHLGLTGPAWPGRPTALLVAALAASVGLGLAPTAVRRLWSRRVAPHLH